MRIEDFHELSLNEAELAELEESMQRVAQAVEEEDIPLPESLKGEALLHLLDGVEQDPAEEEPREQTEKPSGHLVFGLFPQKYLAVAAMLAMAVMVGAVYQRMPRTEVPDSTDSSSSASASAAEQTAEESSTSQGQNSGYADLLRTIESRYNPVEKPVYRGEPGPMMQNSAETVPETAGEPDEAKEQRAETAFKKESGEQAESEEQSAEQPAMDRSGSDAEESSTVTGSSTRSEEESEPAPETVSPEEAGPAQDAAVPPPPVNAMPSVGSMQGSAADESVPEPGASGAGQDSGSGETGTDVAPETSADTTAFRAASVEDHFTAVSAEGDVYTLVPTQDNACSAQLVVEPSGGEAVTMEITSDEPLVYSQVLYDDDRLVLVGNLLEYPEEYLSMTRTVYEEVGEEGHEVTEDLRNSFTEMTSVRIYSVAGEDPAQLTESGQFYQAGWFRDAQISGGQLYTVSSKTIYGVNGLTEYLTEVIPVVSTASGLDYLDSSRIQVDDASGTLDSYMVLSRLNLGSLTDCLPDFEAWLGDQMPVVQITPDGIYLGRSVSGEDGVSSRLVRFDSLNFAEARSATLDGELIPGSFVYLPDTGFAVLVGTAENDTGGGISACTVVVLDRSLAVVSETRLPVEPEEILGVQRSYQ